MTPFMMYMAAAALLGFSVYKKWWGITAFAGCVLVWMLLMQAVIAYMMHGTAN
jgi:hypothetical protein